MDGESSNADLDNSILQRAIYGDVLAFEQLIIKYEKLIFNIAYRMLGSLDDAKDASQEVLLRAYRNLRHCVSIDHFKYWVCMITSNICIDEIRKRKGLGGKVIQPLDKNYRSPAQDSDGPQVIQIPSSEPTPEELLEKKELKKTIQDAIDNLSENHKIFIVLRDIHGFSYDEIAQITLLPIGTVKSRISRARENLKKILTEMKIFDL